MSNEPAYPVPEDNLLSNGTYNNSGLTKRELIAAMAMQGLIAANYHVEYEDAAKHAVLHADALLEALK